MSDSANVHVPWWVEGHGLLALSTGTLVEQSTPYVLPVELARGVVNQLRNQLSDWQMIGLIVPGEVSEKLTEAIVHSQRGGRAEGRAGRGRGAESAVAAGGAGRLAIVGQRLRRAGDARPPPRRASRCRCWAATWKPRSWTTMPPGSSSTTFNMAVVPICWRDVEASEGAFSWGVCDTQIEWCRSHGLRVCAGPLLQLDARSLPDWIYLFEDDFDNLQASATEFVRAAVTRYRGKVDLWQCAGRVNASEVLSLSEEEKLLLAAAAIKQVRAVDPAAPALLSIEQPWCEHVARREVDFPPLQFADALLRAGLDLKGLMLEVNLGYGPAARCRGARWSSAGNSTAWSLLGLPLCVALTVPGGWGRPVRARRGPLPPGSWSLQGQQAWIARYVPLILAKPIVQAVVWNQLRDGVPHDFPNAGLLDDRGQMKPAMRTLR